MIGVITIYLVYFCYLHFKLLLHNLTTIDHTEKQEKDVEFIENNVILINKLI